MAIQLPKLFTPPATPAPARAERAPVAPALVQQPPSFPASRTADAFVPASNPSARVMLGLDVARPVFYQSTPVGGVSGVAQSTPRVQVDGWDQLAQLIAGDGLQNADVNIPIDLSILKGFTPPPRPPPNPNGDLMSWTEVTTTTEGQTALASWATAQIDPANDANTNAMLQAIADHPDLGWNELFRGSTLDGTTFHGPVTYANFAFAEGRGVTFAGPVTDTWMLGADLPHASFQGDVTGSNFTGAELRHAQFNGEVSRNAFNSASLVDADFTGVTASGFNDFAFARLDGATFGAGQDWSTSVFTGAVTTGAANAPVAMGLLEGDLDMAALEAALGGEARVRELMEDGGLLDAVLNLGSPYADAMDGMLPSSWRSYLADGLGDGQPIKPVVYDAVDGRYGDHARTNAPTLANVYRDHPESRMLIDRQLGELILRRGRLDDPMGLQGSAQGRTPQEWESYVTGTEVFWASDDGLSVETFTEGSRHIADMTVPRPTLDELYRQLNDRGFYAEAEALQANLDVEESAFTLRQLFDSGAYPNAEAILWEILSK